MQQKPIIDKEKCELCGLCVSVCACGALAIVDNELQAVNMENCRWCTLCELVCPSGAISCPFEIIIDNDQDT